MEDKIFVVKDSDVYTLFKQNSNDNKAHNFISFSSDEVSVVVNGFVKHLDYEQLNELFENIAQKLVDMKMDDLNGGNDEI